jgi:hypothetical protein
MCQFELSIPKNQKKFKNQQNVRNQQQFQTVISDLHSNMNVIYSYLNLIKVLHPKKNN